MSDVRPSDAPPSPDDETLTAYLDDELTPGERRRFESRLAVEPELSDRLRRWRQEWNALADWDCPSPTRDLVSSTLEMAAVDDGTDPPGGEPAARRRWFARWRLPISAAVLLAIGFVAARGWDRRRSARVLRELPLVIDQDAYRRGDAPELLDRLRDEPAWERYGRMVDDRLPTGTLTGVRDTDQLGDRIAAWSDEQRETLATRLDAWRRLPGRTRDAVVATADRVARRGDGDRRLVEMRRLATIKRSMTPEARQIVDDAARPVDARVAAVLGAIDRNVETYSRNDRGMIDEATADAIRGALDQILDRRLRRDDQTRTLHQYLETVPTIDDPRDEVLRRTLVPTSDTYDTEVAGLLDDEWLLIELSLPIAADRELERWSLGEPSWRRLMLGQWIHESMHRSGSAAADDDPMTRYRALSPQRRERLDLSEPSVFRSELGL